jgi:hypothetical protein
VNKTDELVYLGRIFSLLARHQQLTLAEIKNKTRHFLRKRHQTTSSLFHLLEEFVSNGQLIRTVYGARIFYAMPEQQRSPVLSKLDLVEAGAETQSELFKKLVEQAKKYKPKDPPPPTVDGFK